MGYGAFSQRSRQNTADRFAAKKSALWRGPNRTGRFTPTQGCADDIMFSLLHMVSLAGYLSWSWRGVVQIGLVVSRQHKVAPRTSCFRCFTWCHWPVRSVGQSVVSRTPLFRCFTSSHWPVSSVGQSVVLITPRSRVPSPYGPLRAI